MEEFVREVLSRYTSFVSERQLYERWLDMRENSDVRDALVMTEMKITMIQIISFVKAHRDMVMALFGDIYKDMNK